MTGESGAAMGADKLISNLSANLRGLGPSRLFAMAGVGLLTLVVIAVGALYLNRPATEVLYTGLEREEVGQMAVALASGGFEFETAADGSSISVPVGQVRQARMFLAERGLPSSDTSGYELFDEIGSLGLTSFMQEVTRVRALEGEIARTIQSIEGIHAARVHIVLGDPGSFRQSSQQPSASVVIRASEADGHRAANPIRHLVAAAVPGLAVGNVTVLDASGTLLASGDDPSNSTMNRSLELLQTVEAEIEANIRKALSPFIGADNFKASVKADINTDSQQIQETIYDPDSRVERSVRIVKEEQAASETTTEDPVTVEQNLPEEAPAAGAGPSSSETTERKEELTNYEINSKTVATVRNSYIIEGLSIAVVVNRARVLEILGAEATPEQIEAYIASIQQIINSAAGVDAERGDHVTVRAVEFIEPASIEPVAAAGGWTEMLVKQASSVVNGLAFLAGILLIVFFGFRPLAKALLRAPASRELAVAGQGEGAAVAPDGAAAANANRIGGGTKSLPGGDGGDPMDDLRRKVRSDPGERLSRMVELSDERTALILRRWANEEAA